MRKVVLQNFKGLNLLTRLLSLCVSFIYWRGWVGGDYWVTNRINLQRFRGVFITKCNYEIVKLSPDIPSVGVSDSWQVSTLLSPQVAIISNDPPKHGQHLPPPPTRPAYLKCIRGDSASHPQESRNFSQFAYLISVAI